LVTVAATFAVAPPASDEGGAVVNVTMIGDGGGVRWVIPPQPERATMATKRRK
jgi:hypothetical protein